MNDKTIIKLFGIGAVTALEGIALLCGFNGTYFALSLSGIVGLAGYELGKRRLED